MSDKKDAEAVETVDSIAIVERKVENDEIKFTVTTNDKNLIALAEQPATDNGELRFGRYTTTVNVERVEHIWEVLNMEESGTKVLLLSPEGKVTEETENN